MILHQNETLKLNRPVTEKTFVDKLGRKCYIVCEPLQNNRPRPQPTDPKRIANLLIGKNIPHAQRIYPNIRVVTRDGVPQPTTQDYQQNRINVETRNGIINRIVGFY